MRNLVEYPVQHYEIIEVLDRAIENNKGAIGGIDGFVLERIKVLLQNNHVAMNKILMECDVSWTDVKESAEKFKDGQ